MSERVGLIRALGRGEVVTLSLGSMIGWSWVVLAGGWVQSAGVLGAILAFALSGLMCVMVGLAYAELASALPLAGGEIIYSYRALGYAWSWVAGWAVSLGYLGIVAFEGVAFATAIDQLFHLPKLGYLWRLAGADVYLTWAAVGVVMGAFLCYLSHRGLRGVAAFQNYATAALVLGGLTFLVSGLALGRVEHMGPLFTDGVGVVKVLLMGPALFLGFGVIPQVAEEVNLPHKLVGKLLVSSILAAVAFYMMIIIGMGVAAPPTLRESAPIPVAEAMTYLFKSDLAGNLMTLAGIAGILTAWNGSIVAASRVIFAMGRSKMLPPAFGRLHPTYVTPSYAIILVLAVTLIAPFLGRGALVWFLRAGSFGSTVAFLLVSISFWRLKKTEQTLRRPYTVHKSIGIVAIGTSAAFLALLLPVGPAALSGREWAIILVWAALGAIMAWGAKVSLGDVSPQQREELMFGRQLARDHFSQLGMTRR